MINDQNSKKNKKRLVLASGSYWRRELLSWFGVPFKVVESGFDERLVKETGPVKLVEMLAREKAFAVAERLEDDREWMDGSPRQTRLVQNHRSNGATEDVVIIGADTVVVMSNHLENSARVIGKPKDKNHAREMLKRLRGNEQKVVTGVCVAQVVQVASVVKVVKVEKGVDVSRVRFGNFSDEELDDYLDGGEWKGKAGAFGILGKAMELIEEVEGSISGVIGLPLLMTKRLLGEVGVRVEVDVERLIGKRLVGEFRKRNPEAVLRVRD